MILILVVTKAMIEMHRSKNWSSMTQEAATKIAPVFTDINHFIGSTSPSPVISRLRSQRARASAGSCARVEAGNSLE